MKGTNKVAYRSVRVSDLTGAEGSDEDFTSIVVRRHPDVTEPVVIDALTSELKGLKSADQLVVLELKNGGDPVQVVTTVTEFGKLSPNIKEVLDKAPGVRGRRPGFRPTAKKE